MDVLRATLLILETQLGELRHIPYFTQPVREYASALHSAAIEISERDDLTSGAMRECVEWFSLGVQFLAGSSAHETPYELYSCFYRVLNEWRCHEQEILTALNNHADDFFSILLILLKTSRNISG